MPLPIGLVGEDSNGVALYLIGLTRKLNEPISAIIFAKLATGKSCLANH